MAKHLVYRDVEGGGAGGKESVLFLVHTESDGGADDAELTRTPGGQDGGPFSICHAWRERGRRRGRGRD